MSTDLYRDQILEIEPTGIEYVPPEQRYGNPPQLCGLWFSANAEIATWMVGRDPQRARNVRSALLRATTGSVAPTITC
ncbi:MAG: hypothetical protein ACYDDQ_09095 [Vulcanimicrobiaceae bacterium]